MNVAIDQSEASIPASRTILYFFICWIIKYVYLCLCPGCWIIHQQYTVCVIHSFFWRSSAFDQRLHFLIVFFFERVSSKAFTGNVVIHPHSRCQNNFTQTIRMKRTHSPVFSSRMQLKWTCYWFLPLSPWCLRRWRMCGGSVPVLKSSPLVGQ